MRRTLRNEGERVPRATGSKGKLKPVQRNDEVMEKWALYTAGQKEVILNEFRRRLPEDYYCKATFFRFLQEKLIEGGQHDGAVERV
jgi:hypothetical protein